MGNLLEKITDLMVIIIRFVGLMADVSDFCENLWEFSIFLECPHRILDDFMCRLERSLQLVIVRYHNLQANCVISSLFGIYLIFHVGAAISNETLLEVWILNLNKAIVF